MFGQKPHALDGLNLLPASTALATFTDLDAPMLWSVVQKQVAQSGFPQAEEMLNKLPDGFEKATGLKWDRSSPRSAASSASPSRSMTRR